MDEREEKRDQAERALEKGWHAVRGREVSMSCFSREDTVILLTL